MRSSSVTDIQDRLRFDGRLALITGAGGHLGGVIAEAFLQLGATVIATDRDRDGLAALVSRTRAPKSQLVVRTVELEQEQDVRAIPRWIETEIGPALDVIVCSAAFVGDSDLHGWSVGFEHQSSDVWRRAIEVNLTSVFALVQSCLPLLRRADAPAIVAVGSIYGVVGPDWALYEGTTLGNPAAYAASKAGLMQLTRWLATTLAPQIRVNAVSPGGIFRAHGEPFLSRYVQRTPLRRMGTEADVVGAVAFLASDLASYVTGQNLLVDGGWTSW